MTAVLAAPQRAPSAPATAFSVAELAAFGKRPALVSATAVLSYADLAERVRDRARHLGRERKLVLVEAANALEPVVTYLAALTSGHPVLLAPAGDRLATAELAGAYDPDVVAGPAGDWRPCQRRDASGHDLHPDLALLLSTSGSTGSPKLVRLSHANLRSNADSIARYLGIRPTDRAMTSLPLHYCYGLSVLHTHLLRGASIVLTDLSVVDPCFWDLFRAQRATTFAGVPHTFELLERVGFAEMDLPSLRYVTQAGGRMHPDTVRRYADLGARDGWELFVMYGQTEATARMAYLPPDLALRHPGSIGVPIPDGSLRVEPVPGIEEPGVGELVYAGPNVMMGYAEQPADLRLGRTVAELRTGDLGRRGDDGLFEVVGRLSRFVKVLGLRVDLARVEAALERLGLRAACAGLDGELAVVVEGAPQVEEVRRHAADAAGLPVTAVRAVAVDALPRLPTGKADPTAITALARQAPARRPERAATPAAPPGEDPAAALRALYAEILARPDVTDEDTFVGLGGDSLSYVEVSLRLEQALGTLPDGWPALTIRQLAGTARRRPGRWRRMETGVALRAAAIVAIVGSHVELFALLGGAHILLGVAGYNLGRFHLTAAERPQRVRHLAASTARIAVPAVAWIAAMAVLFGNLGWTNVALVHTLVGSDTWGPQWHYWFIEAAVLILLAVTALLAVPGLDRVERRWPFGFALGLLGLGLLTRYDLVVLPTGTDRIHTPQVIFWLFALGWAIAKASTRRDRWLLTGLVLATLPGFFGNPFRDAVVAAGLLALIWAPTVPWPAALSRVAGVLASASLYIYLTHWQVYPHLERDYPLLALLASVAVGIAYWLVCRGVESWLRQRRRAQPRPAPEGVRR